MRKTFGALAVGLVLAVCVAPAALAQQRDPFAPVISLQPDDGTTDPGVPGVVDPVDPVPPPTDSLPGTGSAPAPWIGIAYALVALGTGAVALSRLFGQPARAR